MSNLGGSALIILMYVVTWALPVLLAIWFIRTLTAMAQAQRDIAERLAGIETFLRASTQHPEQAG